MKKKSITAFFVILSICTLAESQMQVVGKLFGTWKLNTQKSKFIGTPIPASELLQYDSRKDGFVLITVHSIDSQGNPSITALVTKFDGQPSPRYRIQELGDLLAAGKKSTSTQTWRRVDDYTVEEVREENGKVTGVTRQTVSKDGKTLTMIQKSNPQGQSFDIIRVYERLPRPIL